MPYSEKKFFIIPFFIPHTGCPHTCIFCNQHTITGQSSNQISPEVFRHTVDQFLLYNNRDHTQISFYGGTFLGLPESDITMLLSEAENYVKSGKVDSIRFSTRPDSITDDKLELISQFHVETIELGVQSMADKILANSGRGHTSQDTESAVKHLKDARYHTGIQLMTGLPGDTEETILETARKTTALSPDFVRIYPALTFRNTKLEELYNSGKYSPMTLSCTVMIVKQMYLLFLKNKISVIRMGLQSSADFENGEDIVAGPYHPAFGHLVYSSVFLDMARMAAKKTERGRSEYIFEVNSRDISKLRGLKNYNIGVLKRELNCDRIRVKSENSLPPDSVRSGSNIVTIASLLKKL